MTESPWVAIRRYGVSETLIHRAWVADLTASEIERLRDPERSEIEERNPHTAICLMEALMEGHLHRDGDPWEDMRARHGMEVVRAALIDLIRAVEVGWIVALNAVSDDFFGSFDYDFVPAFLKACVAVDASGAANVKPGWIEACRAIAVLGRST